MRLEDDGLILDADLKAELFGGMQMAFPDEVGGCATWHPSVPASNKRINNKKIPKKKRFPPAPARIQISWLAEFDGG